MVHQKDTSQEVAGYFFIAISRDIADRCAIGDENSSCRPFCVPNGKIPLRGIFRARGLQGNVDKMGWSRCVEEYMRQGPGMPGPYGAMENCMGGIQGKMGGRHVCRPYRGSGKAGSRERYTERYTERLC